jgi:tRNA1(Val) A37 N6-methylase TrmN6
MENNLFLAPIVDDPQNILDLGTGSGIWAMDVADMYPSAVVIGVDTAPVQPNLIPPNLTFEVPFHEPVLLRFSRR